MAEIKLEHFIHDLVWLLKEDYNESLDRINVVEDEKERAFEEGQNFAYWRVLEVIGNQLSAFGADEELYNGIAPEPGKRAEFKKAKF